MSTLTLTPAASASDFGALHRQASERRAEFRLGSCFSLLWDCYLRRRQGIGNDCPLRYRPTK
jgi:hypothetical protein